MTDDDRDVGRLLSRREAVALLAATGAAWWSGVPLRAESTGRCVVRPEQTEGPYFVDEILNRADIRSDPKTGKARAGTPIEIAINVSRLTRNGCDALPGARVDLWQCDAEGFYSDVRDRRGNTVGQQFLRGYQLAGKDGTARFTTIYPGWYSGRTVHIHFKVRVERLEFTSQLYFDDALTDKIHAAAPYSSRGRRTVRNANDGIYRGGGEQLQLAIANTGNRIAGSLALAMQF